MWSQRYLINDTYFAGTGYPIILLLGGEGTTSTSSVTGHYIINEWAQQLKALIVSVEHRYYGSKKPFV